MPKVTDHVATPLRHRRNFVRKNAISAMCAQPLIADDENFVDYADGNTQSRKKSGNEPVFSVKKVLILFRSIDVRT